MAETPSTTLLNENFSGDQKRAIWNKATTIFQTDANKFRKDKCGDVIEWDKYSDRNHKNGWEVDHIVPRFLEGKKGFEDFDFDNMSNLQPLNWSNNVAKDNHHPWECPKK